jgi:uncharacterized metal-binding protein YceD (DUF177 family)
MHVNVRDILAEAVGYSRSYKITGERPQLEAIRLTKDIGGEVTISRLDSSLLVRGHLQTEIELVCHRCLRTFTRPVSIRLEQLYAENPGDDEMPIVDREIDLAPLAEQEIQLSLPIKILHADDCRGIENAPESYTSHEGNSLKNQARITKGTQRGRT